MYTKRIESASEGVTFDDLLLVPQKTSVEPTNVDVSTKVTRGTEVNIPIVSSPMDTVTEEGMAIAIARMGGLGIIHRNQSIKREEEIVAKVKREESIVIKNVMTIKPDMSIKNAFELMRENDITGLPVVNKDGKLVGILTVRDIRFFREKGKKTKAKDLMSKDLVTAREDIDMKEAIHVMHRHRIEKLLVIDKKGKLVGLITAKDILKRERFPGASRDKEGRLLVGAALGPFDLARAKALEKAEADLLVVDTAHAHNTKVMKYLGKIKKEVDIPVIAGNIATKEAAEDLIALDVDGLRVGLGPGSICTTRIVAGIGIPQLTAISMVADVASQHDIPVIADGGIRFSGDIAKAIAAGADAVMIGGLLAGTKESPGRELILGGRKYKYYRGMGSMPVMERGLSDRYSRESIGATKMVPEGVEGAVPYKGKVNELVGQLVGGIKASMGYIGAKNVEEMKKRARFMRVSLSSSRESHPHDIKIISEAPNYPLSHNQGL